MPGIPSERIVSERAILLEGDSGEIVPNAKLAASMHGFVIMVPPGEGGERLLDMLWRITMLYAEFPRLLRSRATVRKMVEAIWGRESRKDKPGRRHAKSAPPPMREAEEETDLEIARRVMRDNRGALHELAGIPSRKSERRELEPTRKRG